MPKIPFYKVKGRDLRVGDTILTHSQTIDLIIALIPYTGKLATHFKENVKFAELAKSSNGMAIRSEEEYCVTIAKIF